MPLRRRHLLSIGTLLAGLGIAGVALAPLAGAQSTTHSGVVSDNPANFTPNVQDDAQTPNAVVQAVAQIGTTTYAAGRFRTTTDAKRRTTYPRNNIMAFDSTNGAMKPFAPKVGGVAWALAPSGNSIFVGGDFGTVNGAARRALVKLNATTGALDPTFRAPITSGRVTELKLVGSRLFVGGSFAKRLMALDPTTGADTNYINVGISGTVARDSRLTDVYKFAVNAAGTRMVAVGNFSSVAGQPRPRAAMINLDADAARLNTWRYGPLANICASTGTADQLRDVDFAPDGSYFVIVASGYIPATTAQIGYAICDAAARFETANAAPARPTWINYTGGDTLHSVAVSGAAVYVQGHMRWMDNAYGNGFPATGAVARQGIAALSPTTGRSLSWNPTKDRDVGGKDFLVTPAGLWVASDGRWFHGEQRWGIAFLPLV